MGKGGTKFVGDSVSVRRKAPSNNTVRDIKRNLEKFMETGVHPELERMRQEHANQLPTLPDLDIHRPFVFMDIAVGGKPLGRLVIELFEDIVPVAASHFRNRCLPGSTASLAGSTFHKLLQRYALYGGQSSRAGEGMRLASCTQLRAVEGGLVAVALTGEDFAIAFDRALNLDRTHQVVGRIHKGSELLSSLGDLRTLPDDSPASRVAVVRCGATNHLGNHEELEAGGGAAGGSGKDAATRLQEASEEARSAVMDALAEGLARKRRPGADVAAVPADEDPGPSASGRPGGGTGSRDGAPGAPRAALAGQSSGAQAGGRNVKAKLLDSMLGGFGSDGGSGSSSSSDESGKEEG